MATALHSAALSDLGIPSAFLEEAGNSRGRAPRRRPLAQAWQPLCASHHLPGPGFLHLRNGNLDWLWSAWPCRAPGQGSCLSPLRQGRVLRVFGASLLQTAPSGDSCASLGPLKPQLFRSPFECFSHRDLELSFSLPSGFTRAEEQPAGRSRGGDCGLATESARPHEEPQTPVFLVLTLIWVTHSVWLCFQIVFVCLFC